MTAPGRVHRTSKKPHAPDHTPHRLLLFLRCASYVLQDEDTREGFIALLEPLSEDLHNACIRLRAEPLSALAAEAYKIVERHAPLLFAEGYVTTSECRTEADNEHPSGVRLELILTLHSVSSPSTTVH